MSEPFVNRTVEDINYTDFTFRSDVKDSLFIRCDFNGAIFTAALENNLFENCVGIAKVMNDSRGNIFTDMAGHPVRPDLIPYGHVIELQTGNVFGPLPPS